MQDIRSSSPPVVTGNCDLNKSRARHHRKEEITKNITFRLQLIDSARFMVTSLSNLVNNLSGGIHKIKSKYGHHDKKYKNCGTNYKHCDCFLE